VLPRILTSLGSVADVGRSRAAGRSQAADRAGRERRLRHCARPPFALERLRERDPEHLLYQSAKPHLELEPRAT